MEQSLRILISLAMTVYFSILPGLSLAVGNMNMNMEAVETVGIVAGAEKQDDYVIFTNNNIKTEDMRKKSRIDQTKLTEYMKKFPNLSGIEGALIEIQEEYDVNALLVLAIVRLESGNGGSKIAKSRNNLGGLVGWEKSVKVFKSFNSREDCLTYMANLLSNHYLTEGGRFFNGYTIKAISKKYCESSEEWIDLVAKLMIEIQEGLNNIEG